MRNVWYTSFVISSLTLLVLAYTEWQIPGFVSYVFPLYLVLVFSIGCGVFALYSGDTKSDPGIWSYVLSVFLGLLFAVIVLRAGDVFGAYRLALALIVLNAPCLLLKALEGVKK